MSNQDSVIIDFIRHKESSIPEIGGYLYSKGVAFGGMSILNDDGKLFLIAPTSYRDVDEENPSVGDYYVIFTDKKVVLYTPAEFEANFKTKINTKRERIL